MRYSGAVMTGEGLRHNIERGAPVRKPRSTSTARLAAAMLVLAAVLPLESAWSQGGSVFRGQVVADSSFAPLPGAQVTLMELERSVDAGPDRSEERRVGKGCRRGWAAGRERKTN